jgi:hypothetical protein
MGRGEDRQQLNRGIDEGGRGIDELHLTCKNALDVLSLFMRLRGGDFINLL